jgi:hypothetical protein
MTNEALSTSTPTVQSTEGLIERVARAVHPMLFATFTDWRNTICDWNSVPESDKNAYRAAARAAIHAIPSEGLARRLRALAEHIREPLARADLTDADTCDEAAAVLSASSPQSTEGLREALLPFAIMAEAIQFAAHAADSVIVFDFDAGERAACLTHGDFRKAVAALSASSSSVEGPTEREKIVAWLRLHPDRNLHAEADAIERGDFLTPTGCDQL